MWEYQEAEPPVFRTSESLVAWLNTFGNDGWELVQLTDVSAVFKREREHS